MSHRPLAAHVSRFALALLLLIWGSAFAQIPGLSLKPSTTAEKAAEPEAPATIEVGELPRRLLEENLFLQQAAQRNAADAKIDALEQRLGDVKRSIGTLGSKIVSKDFDALPYSGLDALQRHLLFLDKRLTQLQDDLQVSTRPLSADAGELAQRRRLWQETRQQSADFIAPELLNDMDALNREFNQVANAVSKPLSRLLDLNREASALQERVGKHLSTIRDRINVIDRKLWNFDAENLFAALEGEGDQAKGNIQSVVSGFAIQADFTKAYSEAARTRHTVLAVVALLALPLFIYLSRWAKRIIGSDTDLGHYRKTLGRPFSAWLLFCIMCLLAIDFDGPWFGLRLLLALAWLPVMRLQPKWVRNNIGGWIYTTAFFFAVSFFSQLITTLPVDYRVTLLINGLLLFGTLLWLAFRLVRNRPMRDLRAHKMALLLFGATGTALAFAVVANLFGGVHLSALLTDAALNNLYLALFLCAARELVHAYAYILTKSDNESTSIRTEHTGRAFEAAFSLFNLALGLTWVTATLYSLRVFDLVKTKLYAISGFTIEAGSISITIGGIVLFCGSVYLSFWIARTLRSVLAEDVLPKMTLPRGVANSVSTMSYYTLLMLGLLVALTAAGFQMSQLALVVGALSVGIGFGLNTVINNFVCGLILMIERPVQPGDTVELSGTTGKIRDIGIRTTTITTFDGADVLVPNGLLLSEKLTNWTLSNRRRRIEVPVGVAYGCAPREVQALLLDVANKIHGISFDPPPSVLFTGFGESSLNFVVRVWTDDFDLGADIGSEMALEIHAALQAAGIEIPFPQRDLHIRSVDAGVVAAVAPTATSTLAERNA